MTKQRAVILEILRSGAHHYTADEIFTLAKQKLPNMSRATVYNNLKALEEEQIIRKISGDGGPDRYDRSYIPHGHLFCSECGMLCDLDTADLDKEIEKRCGCIVDSYELKVRGICSSCVMNKIKQQRQ